MRHTDVPEGDKRIEFPPQNGSAFETFPLMSSMNLPLLRDTSDTRRVARGSKDTVDLLQNSDGRKKPKKAVVNADRSSS